MRNCFLCGLTAACSAFAAAPAGAVFIDPALPGTTQLDAWDNLAGTNPQVAGANPAFPTFFTSTAAWPEPIESLLTQGTTATGDDDATGDAAFDKVAGGGYPAGTSTYNSFDPGTFTVFDTAPVSNIETVVFQVELGPGVSDFGGPDEASRFFVPGGAPVLNFNGGAQSLAPVDELVFATGNNFPNPGPGPPELSTQVFLFQWDLRGQGAVSAYDIVWSTAEFGTNYRLQLDAGDSFALARTPGDIDGDFDVDANDIDLLHAALGAADPVLDLDGDGGAADKQDVAFLVRDILMTEFGDADLDRVVGMSDFTALEANFAGGGGWTAGDFDGDAAVGPTDFSLLAAKFGFENPASVGATPEPFGLAMAAAAASGGGVLRRRTQAARGSAATPAPR